ncbi:hypothetical protein BEL04_06310 [Mucilaginibacter sp. PPCGB 2223]|uniref:L,D-transpeptidase family protein n=1 Tax=Mucilaginibacter sp. PPCGB 2223 TaxID=1886027 RepID=UPI0008248A3C|nr:L,D-transpeptidase family protein [Mucilaginibacter sp. PPCGB 2223]OCX53895.1 hypothetical protein BEL04_06310 [Mucilaginibacter sp. PPCGB 2223]
MKAVISIVFLLTALTAGATVNRQNHDTDSALTRQIQIQLTGRQAESSLYFPHSVIRFYEQRGFAAAWIGPQNETGRAWQAMLMIDCVLQFGLSHNDFHPAELLYSKLHNIMDAVQTPVSEKAHFDILLTDAIITFMNYLHYGKLNPYYLTIQIDNGLKGNLQADVYLNTVIDHKSLISDIAAVQPQNKLYADMQEQLHLLKSLYLDDCYEVPEADVRRLAVDMERLRWDSPDDSTYIQINIPSYTLTYYRPDTSYLFKVVVGKPATPTPTLSSAIRYFTTSPEWRVPQKIFVKELLPKALADTAYLSNNHFTIYNKNGGYVPGTVANLTEIKKHPSAFHIQQSAGCDNALGSIVFRFDNIYDIYLHDTPEQQLFASDKRTFSHGCIRVEHAENLAVLLLQNDGSANKIDLLRKTISRYKKTNFTLKRPVPIYVTYLTCMVKDGILVTFDDPYNLDKSLEMAIYGVNNILSRR